MLQWDDFKVFSAVARAGSVRGAAQDLGIHASTVARRLDQFEKQLGVLLFNRSATGLQITPEGAEAVQDIERVADQLAAIERRLQGRDSDLAGDVRLQVPEVLGFADLMDALVGFRAEYPDVVLDIVSGAPLDLIRREADVAVRLTNTPDENLVGREIGRLSIAVYARAQNREQDLAQNHAQKEPVEGWIHAGWASTASELVHAQHFASSTTVLRCAEASASLASVRQGLGVGLLPCFLADADTELVPISPRPIDLPEQQIWLLTHPDLRAVARVRVLTEFIVDTFAGFSERLHPPS